jgi:hypothetical protein
MSGYLDQYGAGEERRENIVKKIFIALAAIIVVGAPLLYIFHNIRQEHRVKQFFSLLAAHDYKTAYSLWGCTDAKPCVGYSLSAFMQDWGPGKGDPSQYRITRSKSCGSGVILNVDFGNERNVLWVQRNNLVIGFSPFPGCPAPTALLGGKAPR